MRILLFGTSGQVGWELRRSLQPLGAVTAVGRDVADFDDPDSLRACFAIAPHLVVNAVAYTAVDQAETDVDRATRVNTTSVGVLADESRRCGALLIHYSTDYVFDGTAAMPYPETTTPDPRSVYGRTKLAGETAIAVSGCEYLIFRTSWVYASRGKNFVLTILRLAGERETLRIVGDQHGAPTAARLIADCTAQIVATARRERAERSFASGVFHLTASGRTSWHGLATHIVERARALGIAPLVVRAVDAIPATDYPLPAQRPSNSSLDTRRVRERFGIELPDWTVGVDQCLDEVWAA